MSYNFCIFIYQQLNCIFQFLSLWHSSHNNPSSGNLLIQPKTTVGEASGGGGISAVTWNRCGDRRAQEAAGSRGQFVNRYKDGRYQLSWLGLPPPCTSFGDGQAHQLCYGQGIKGMTQWDSAGFRQPGIHFGWGTKGSQAKPANLTTQVGLGEAAARAAICTHLCSRGCSCASHVPKSS